MDTFSLPTLILSSEKKSKISAIATEIKQHQKIIVLGHIKPDWDCVGSQQALARTLRKIYPGKEIYSPFPENFWTSQDPQIVTEQSRVLALVNELPKIDDYSDFLLITVDVNSLNRTMLPKIQPKKWIIIDHHQLGTEHADEKNVWIDSTRCAAAELLAEVIFFLNQEAKIIDNQIATLLMLGIWSDSISFVISSVGSHTHTIMAWLMRFAPDFQEFLKKYINVVTQRQINVGGFVYQSLVNDNDIAIFSYDSTKTHFKINNLQEMNGLINSTSFVDETIASIYMIQIKKDSPIVFQLRNSEKKVGKTLNLRTYAQKYNGGGHSRAAGFIVENWAIANKILEELKTEIHNPNYI